MPSDQYGFSGQEILSLVQNYLGDTSQSTQTFITQMLPLAEMRFCKAHDWSFLYKVMLPLACTNGQDQYSLSTSTIGYYMPADNVENIFDTTNGKYIKKVTLPFIRRLNPMHDDGNANDQIRMWAPIGDNNIIFYPPNFASVTLEVDGKISPPALSTLSNYPTIPYRYQESFIQYCISLGLDKANDDRFPAKKKEALDLIKLDIQADLDTIGDTDEPRFKHLNEARNDGVTGNLALLYNNIVWNQYW